ncbi:hypothetical protein ACPCBC_18530 [Streptomyces incarnatus]
MSPEPTLQRTGLNPVGACLADDHSAGERRPVTLSYRLTGVVDKAKGEGLAAITVTSPCFGTDGTGRPGR